MIIARLSTSAAIAVVAVLLATTPPASAHWLDRLVRVAGDAGGDTADLSAKLGKAGLPHLGDAAGVLGKLPDPPGTISLAAHATPEGHWQFLNRNGDVFTAASPEEMARATQMLAAEVVAAAAGTPKLTLVLSEETVFRQSARLGDLPADASLRIASGKTSFPVLAKGSGPTRRWLAEVRPGLVLDLGSGPLYREALWQLSRPMSKTNVRLLTFETGAPGTISLVPKRDATGRILPDLIAPEHLANALRSHAGSTVIVSGRISGGLFDSLPFGLSRPTPGGISPEDLRKAAANADVNLVALNTSGAWQPGGRNWFGQTIEVEGLASALEQPTFGEFLVSLARRNGRHELKLAEVGSGRVRLDVVPEPGDGGLTDMAGSVGEWLGEAVSHVTGEIVTSALSADVNDRQHQEELDQRLIPGVPSAVPFAYLGALVAGIIGWGVARAWWFRLWPASDSQRWHGRLGRLLLFLFVFLPVVGLPALVWSLVLQIWVVVSWPFRAVAWLAARWRPQSS